jgi:hypothetical protein
MKKERAMALFIGMTMILSIVGIAISMATRTAPVQQAGQIPTVVTIPLSDDQIRDVFMSGRVLLEYFYPANCTACLDTRAVVEGFAEGYDGYIVLDVVAGNESRFDMIGGDGRITGFGQNATQKDLLDTLCQVAIGVPQECIIDIGV